MIAEIGWRLGDLITGAANLGLLQARSRAGSGATGAWEYQKFFDQLQAGMTDLANRLEDVRQLYFEPPA